MATNQTTARALLGLGHDLTDDELLALTDSDNRPALKEFLATRLAQMWRQVSYDQSIGLVALIHRAVGSGNIRNVNTDITQDRFPLKSVGVRSVKCRVEAYLDGETSEQAAKRLTAAGHKLASTGDLAGFLHDHPDQVAQCAWVLAISEDSRWTYPDGRVSVPGACVDGADRGFRLDGFRARLDSAFGVLVLSE
ncbi:hypothetical protein HY477_02295 [Candidatus Uhrbacteria bacterium]|nr:hypothetical protein [Candidatus Uhrbacteria bacterium]